MFFGLVVARAEKATKTKRVRIGTYVIPKVLEFFPRGGLAPHHMPVKGRPMGKY